jgi:GT2 family glycosyltransferase
VKIIPDISICLVALNAGDYLYSCLVSIQKTKPKSSIEIIISDNHSTDGTIEMLAEEFPDIQLIRNPKNGGFAKPANLAIQASKGRYILLLNPDTVVHGNALDTMVDFLDTQPKVGIVGPKILNRDGSLQKQCRRSEGRPWDAFCHLSGLAEAYPKNPRYNGYLMSYIGENETHEVQAVSGACMLIRREVIDQVGLLDERFFAYQEDSDLCRRSRQAGWTVTYLPTARVTHYGGKGGATVHFYRSLYEWHHSYYMYYRKHFAREYSTLYNHFIYLIIFLKMVGAFFINFFRREKSIGRRKP